MRPALDHFLLGGADRQRRRQCPGSDSQRQHVQRHRDFITPWLVSLVVGTGAGGIDLGDTLLDLCAMLLLPLVLGQLMRPLLGKFFARHKKYTNLIDKLVILLLVYAAFCNSMISGMWQSQGNSVILTAFVGTALLLAVILLMTTRTARVLKFDHADKVAAVFCATKKSLAAGAPMAALIFGSNPGLGLILLPIMIYHPMQLIVCSIIAESYASRHRQQLSAAALEEALPREYGLHQRVIIQRDARVEDDRHRWNQCGITRPQRSAEVRQQALHRGLANCTQQAP